MSQPDLEVSVVIPCLNEEHTVGVCVAKARTALDRLGAPGEVVVVDNGSTDRSAAVAAAAGARVVPETRRGYGQAYLSGFAAARGRYLVMGDADDTYDFSDLSGFIARCADPDRGPEHPLPRRHLRRPLRAALDHRRRGAATPPADDRNGVRVRDDHQGGA
jgi:glycosyltransferase involved in cell wall biosynthesis